MGMGWTRWPAVMVLGVALLLPARAGAQSQPPLVILDLPTDGPQYSFGAWLRGALGGEPLRLRWPAVDGGGSLDETPAAVVTWSMPDSSGRRTRWLRDLVRRGGGLVYVVGSGPRHIRRARSFWSALDVNLEDSGGQSGFATWADHPLVAEAGEIGAVSPGAFISGVGGNPLARVGAGAVAMTFDWGPLGRAVIIDQSLLFDELHQDSPRPAVRAVLVRAVRWAVEGDREDAKPVAPPISRAEGGLGPGVSEAGPVGPPPAMSALLDVPNDRDDWPAIRAVLTAALERAHLEVRDAPVVAGEAVLTEERLAGVGLLVVGSGREEVAVSEALAVGRFFEAGGRLLFIGHATARSQKRMIGFNQLLNALPMAASLNRPGGFLELVPHPITAGLTAPGDVRIRPGMQIWSPLADPLVKVHDRPAAAAWQSGAGRVVLIDGELLLAPPRQDRPLPAMLDLLRNAVDWLLGVR